VVTRRSMARDGFDDDMIAIGSGSGAGIAADA
jgi:hypothetical protein